MVWLTLQVAPKLFFFEDDMRAVAAYQGEHEVYHPSELKGVLWKHVLSHPTLLVSPIKSSDQAKEFGLLVQELTMGIHLTLSEYSDFGEQVFKNTRQNSQKSVQNGHALFGSMKNIPALVCGAGPSLLKLKKPLGLTLACGSAIPILSKAHIPFSAGVALDPHPLHAKFIQEGPYDAPLFYQNRVAPELVDLFSGQKLLIGARDFMSKKLGLDPIDPGWNAGTFGFVLAYLLGCDPIITIGIEGSDKADFAMGLRFIEEFKRAHPDRTYQKELCSFDLLTLPEAPPLIALSMQQIDKSLTRCQELIEALMIQGGNSPLHDVELQEEAGYKEVLSPIWDVWKPLIDGDDPLKKLLFLQTVCSALEL